MKTKGGYVVLRIGYGLDDFLKIKPYLIVKIRNGLGLSRVVITPKTAKKVLKECLKELKESEWRKNNA